MIPAKGAKAQKETLFHNPPDRAELPFWPKDGRWRRRTKKGIVLTFASLRSGKFPNESGGLVDIQQALRYSP
jgi:hypothetical protein